MAATTSEDSRILSVRIPSWAGDRLDELAKEQKTTVTQVLRQMLDLFFLRECPPGMRAALEADQKAQGLDRKTYVYACLEGRYRRLIEKESRGEAAPPSRSRK